ncbi:hypothetical protein [Flavobacterium sp. UBA6031]|uniref:hypothetical protein n=1 Tax=Flavobacterium sp. UBA6031 TaxID=1946551 RepID=UPI0025BB843C|nr:hypothetical protein [Flavobacterium sp. UBA6031]
MRKLVLMIISLLIFGMANAQQPTEKPQTSISDSIAMVEYVKNNWQDPKEYMLDKLANYKLVIYGEVHKRKASWDLLRSILKAPAFSKKTGTIFLEIGRDNQDKMDSFFANRQMDKEIPLSILRNIQMQGWDDRGMYEFIIDLWNLNKKLTKNNKVKVVLVDIPRPWSSLKTKEEFSNFLKNIPDRNQQMADMIEKKINSQTDKRNSLFVVGFGHAFKSKIIIGENSYVSAGAYLKEHFSDKEVFITCPHSGINGNTGKMKGMTNNGIFDYSFAKNGNKPMAFNLANSPFGKEHFDLMIELPSESAGNFENYFDGYIFFMPLAEEGPYFTLPELFTEDFLQELRRRANICGYDDWQEYGVKIKDITMKDIHKYLQETSQNKYWKNILSD